MEEGDQIPSLPGFFKKSCFIHDVSFHGFTVIPSMLRISVAELRRVYSNSHLKRKLQLKLRLVVIWLSTTFIMINQTVGLPGLIENNIFFGEFQVLLAYFNSLTKRLWGSVSKPRLNGIIAKKLQTLYKKGITTLKQRQ